MLILWSFKFRSYRTDSKIQEHWIRSSVFSYWMQIYFKCWEDGFAEWYFLIVLQYFVSSILNTFAPDSLENFRFKDEDDYDNEIWLKGFSRILKL